jgi:hypothetical protein
MGDGLAPHMATQVMAMVLAQDPRGAAVRLLTPTPLTGSSGTTTAACGALGMPSRVVCWATHRAPSWP